MANAVFTLSNRKHVPGFVDSNGHPRPFFEPRYKNSGSLAEFLGNEQPLFLEVVAVRLWQTLNGCETLDWRYENSILVLIRELGLGLRWGFFLSNASILISSFYLEEPIVGQFNLSKSNYGYQFGNLTIVICWLLWCFCAALIALAYLLIGIEGTRAKIESDWACAPFYRVPTRQLREYRQDKPMTCYIGTSNFLLTVYYVLYFCAACVASHTVLSHMYSQQNQWFAALLIVNVVLLLLTSLFDLSLIGSPWGVQEASRTASLLVCVRGLIFVPMTAIWSAAAIYAAFPPIA